MSNVTHLKNYNQWQEMMSYLFVLIYQVLWKIFYQNIIFLSQWYFRKSARFFFVRFFPNWLQKNLIYCVLSKYINLLCVEKVKDVKLGDYVYALYPMYNEPNSNVSGYTHPVYDPYVSKIDTYYESCTSTFGKKKTLQFIITFFSHKTCLVAHNYTLSPVNRMYGENLFAPPILRREGLARPRTSRYKNRLYEELLPKI